MLERLDGLCGTNDVLVVSIVDNAGDEPNILLVRADCYDREYLLRVISVCTAEQKGFRTHDIKLHPHGCKTIEVFTRRHNCAALANCELLHTDGQIINVNHGNAGINKLLGHLHGRCERRKAHVTVSDNGREVVPVFKLSTLLLGVSETELPLSLVVPEL